MEKSPNLGPIFNLLSVFLLLRGPLDPIMVLLEDMNTIYDISQGILEKIFFSHFSVIFGPKFFPKSEKLAKFRPKNGQKFTKNRFFPKPL